MERGVSIKTFARSQLLRACLLFAVPLLGLWFSRHAIDDYDANFLSGVSQAIEQEAGASAAQRQEGLAFFRQYPASALCRGDANGPMVPSKEALSELCSDLLQLRAIRLASLGSLWLGLLALCVMLACAGLAFSSRQAQYLSFVTGWNVLRVASLVQVVAQGFVLVMLSYWLSAFFLNIYVPKLIAVLACLAAIAAYRAIRAIFHEPADKLSVEGEELARSGSPALWSRVEAICSRLGTQPPDQIIGGIDDNFFVTEHPVHLGERVLHGRTLFVSLSLLRRLEKREADAILAHEMAHFSGQDTAHSKRMAPLLSRYVHYLGELAAGVVSLPIFFFMQFYYLLFQFALARTERARELRADRIGAETTSAEAMGISLIKVGAYSAYRARVERGLFERNSRHSSLDIAHSMALGFDEYAHGPRLQADLQSSAFPHPFDHHPELDARLANVGASIAPERVPELLSLAPNESWFSEIECAAEIEDALWGHYQARFQAQHEENLALRYLPATPEERALVERYFPPGPLRSKQGEALGELDCEQLSYREWDAPVRLSEITELVTLQRVIRGNALSITVKPEAGKPRKLQLPLRRLADADVTVAKIARYHSRARRAKSFSTAPAQSAVA